MSSTTTDLSSNLPSTPIEIAKRNAAQRAVHEHFDPRARYIGIGSGSTIVYVVEAITALEYPNTSNILFVPTGYQSRQVIYNAGLKDVKFDSLPKDVLIDVAFDGADEVDEELNCIKGGGACLYQEKLVATQAKKFICVAGPSWPLSVPQISWDANIAHRLPQTKTPPSNYLAHYPHRSRAPRLPGRPLRTPRPRLHRPLHPH